MSKARPKRKVPRGDAEKQKVLRVDELQVPKKLENDDFDLISQNCNIPQPARSDLKECLASLVQEFDRWMKEDRLKPHRSSDRDHLNDALSRIGEIINDISNVGPLGRLAMEDVSAAVAPMLSARWMNAKFPDDDYAPRKSPVPLAASGERTASRTQLRGPEYFIEEYSLEARMQFVSRRSVKVTAAALETIKKGLEAAIRSIDRQPGSRGGRKRIIYRHFLLINLAQVWSDLGKQVASGDSDFTTFCESVAEAIGWPTEGIKSAIPKAVADLRNRRGKTRQ
jgi:hypothetical protein